MFGIAAVRYILACVEGNKAICIKAREIGAILNTYKTASSLQPPPADSSERGKVQEIPSEDNSQLSRHSPDTGNSLCCVLANALRVNTWQPLCYGGYRCVNAES